MKKNKQANQTRTKKALITGITGQDGSYLAELLLKKGYEVHGMIRRSSSINTSRIDPIYHDPHAKGEAFFLHYGDITDSNTVYKLVEQIQPHEIYNLAAQSHVRVSFDLPEYTINTVGLGAVRILEAIRDLKTDTKFYQASSSEMFGSAPAPQNEKTAFSPRSPYGAAKLLAHSMTVDYRDAYGIFAVSGILFNHESPRRGETFVTRKITIGIAKILSGQMDKLYLGNLEAKRDWGYAGDYVRAMWMMLQQKKPDNFVIATGETHTVREFLEEAFGLVGLNWKKYVEIDPKYFRPTEVNILKGDYSKAKKVLGWEPEIKFKKLVKMMLASDLEKYGIKKKI